MCRIERRERVVNMGKCLKCNQEIDYLVRRFVEENRCMEFVSSKPYRGDGDECYLDADGYEQIDTIDISDIRYNCPKCDRTLFGDVEDDVLVEFLKKEVVVEW